MKKRTNRDTLVPLWVGLLILGGPASLLGAADEGFGELEVHVDDGLVSLHARDVPVQDVLQEIVVRSDLRLVQHLVLNRVISLSVERQPLPDVLDEILRNDSYQLYQSPLSEADTEPGDAIQGILWIFSEGSALAPAATIIFETVLYLGDAGEKKGAIRELRRLGTPDAVQTLSVALGDEDSRVRKAAMEALSSIGGDEALAAIASASMNEDPRMRGKATYALAGAGGYSSIEYLNLALRDEDPYVRASAIDSLGDVGDARAIQIIGQALHDPNSEVRERAVDVLDELEADAMFRALFPLD